MTYHGFMSRNLTDSLAVIKSAAEEIRREQWSWESLREAQKLRWRLHRTNASPQSLSATPPNQLASPLG